MKSCNSCPPLENLFLVTFTSEFPLQKPNSTSKLSSPDVISSSNPVPWLLVHLALLNNAVVMASTKNEDLPPPLFPITATSSGISSKKNSSLLYDAKFFTLIEIGFIIPLPIKTLLFAIYYEKNKIKLKKDQT
ncbi:hypothetical protein D3C75_644900 [compost metagenome]